MGSNKPTKLSRFLVCKVNILSRAVLEVRRLMLSVLIETRINPWSAMTHRAPPINRWSAPFQSLYFRHTRLPRFRTPVPCEENSVLSRFCYVLHTRRTLRVAHLYSRGLSGSHPRVSVNTTLHNISVWCVHPRLDLRGDELRVLSLE